MKSGKKIFGLLLVMTVMVSSLSLTAQQDKVIRIISNGDAVSEFKVEDIDHVEIKDMGSAPADVRAVLSGDSVIINWDAVEDAVYNVYRSCDNVKFSEIATELDHPYFTDVNPMPGFNYYKVKAIIDGLPGVGSESVGVFVSEEDDLKSIIGAVDTLSSRVRILEESKDVEELHEIVDSLDSRVSRLEENISTLSTRLSSLHILADESTGERYRLLVDNGQLCLKNVNYQKAMFIGSSFVNHAQSESIGWNYEGAMAPSIAANSLPRLVLRSLKSRAAGCTLDIVSSLEWEKNYNNDSYDFDEVFRPSLQSSMPDVIFMHISGNSVWTEEFLPACDKLIKDIKGVCPLADIFIAASWHGGQKAADFRAACVDNDVSYVDLSRYRT
ncbi:MAG: hypothetical protein K2J15_00165, partial [Muribaculaceae bacterium]|nr:hypothetical protein [Muribaculaceae bacterium]